MPTLSVCQTRSIKELIVRAFSADSGYRIKIRGMHSKKRREDSGKKQVVIWCIELFKYLRTSPFFLPRPQGFDII